MSKLNFADGLNFDIYIIDLCEVIKPQTAEDLNEFSDDLHIRIEMAIEDFISDTGLSGEYESQY